MTSIQTAAPRVILQGLQVLDRPPQSVTSADISRHTPIFYLFGSRGETGTYNKDGATYVFGQDTFDESGIYANHQTLASNAAFRGGQSAQKIVRVIPSDAPKSANVTLAVEVLPTQIPVYQRNADGTIKRDVLGKPLKDGTNTVAGVKLKFVTRAVTDKKATDADSAVFGKQLVVAGTMTDGTNTSQVYPLVEQWVPWFGAAGNNIGFSLWSPTTQDVSGFDTELFAATKAYPFYLRQHYRATPTASAQTRLTLQGSSEILSVLKPGARNPRSGALVDFASVKEQAYSAPSENGRLAIKGELKGTYVYRDNIETVQNLILAAEQAAAGAGADFSVAAPGQGYQVNLFGAKHSTGVPYYAVEVDNDSADSVLLREGNVIWARAGGDGTMSQEEYDNFILADVDKYLDRYSSYQDTVNEPGNHIYDTGFSLAVKKALPKILGVRKDTFVTLSTFVYGTHPTLDESIAVGTLLQSVLSTFVESETFGTPAARGEIYMNYGRYLQSTLPGRFPVTLEIVERDSLLMGGTKWNKDELYASGDKADLRFFTDVEFSFIPDPLRDKLAKLRLNYVLPKSVGTVFHPATKTCFPVDGSAAQDRFVVKMTSALQLIGEQVWRNHTNTRGLTEAQFKKRVEEDFTRLASNGEDFADVGTIKPVCEITAGDKVRGYSWHLLAEVSTTAAPTVQVFRIDLKRLVQS